MSSSRPPADKSLAKPPLVLLSSNPPSIPEPIVIFGKPPRPPVVGRGNPSPFFSKKKNKEEDGQSLASNRSDSNPVVSEPNSPAHMSVMQVKFVGGSGKPALEKKGSGSISVSASAPSSPRRDAGVRRGSTTSIPFVLSGCNSPAHIEGKEAGRRGSLDVAQVEFVSSISGEPVLPVLQTKTSGIEEVIVSASPSPSPHPTPVRLISPCPSTTSSIQYAPSGTLYGPGVLTHKKLVEMLQKIITGCEEKEEEKSAPPSPKALEDLRRLEAKKVESTLAQHIKELKKVTAELSAKGGGLGFCAGLVIVLWSYSQQKRLEKFTEKLTQLDGVDHDLAKGDVEIITILKQVVEIQMGLGQDPAKHFANKIPILISEHFCLGANKTSDEKAIQTCNKEYLQDMLGDMPVGSLELICNVISDSKNKEYYHAVGFIRLSEDEWVYYDANAPYASTSPMYKPLIFKLADIDNINLLSLLCDGLYNNFRISIGDTSYFLIERHTFVRKKQLDGAPEKITGEAVASGAGMFAGSRAATPVGEPPAASVVAPALTMTMTRSG